MYKLFTTLGCYHEEKLPKLLLPLLSLAFAFSDASDAPAASDAAKLSLALLSTALLLLLLLVLAFNKLASSFGSVMLPLATPMYLPMPLAVLLLLLAISGVGLLAQPILSP
jgi:uncharacterized integral membrane protein